jgi:hypothetical protein
MSMPQYISNKRLRAEKMPLPAADWSEIQRFALTFDGYEHWGSFDQCAATRYANGSPYMPFLRAAAVAPLRLRARRGQYDIHP